MTEPLPADEWCPGRVYHDDETDEDWHEGPCIEKALVRGLDAGPVEGGHRCGELVVEAADGITHTFKIHVTHQFLIPEGVYTLIGSERGDMVRTIQHWAVGQRLPGGGFKKVSVFAMDWKEDEMIKSLCPAARSSDVRTCLV